MLACVLFFLLQVSLCSLVISLHATKVISILNSCLMNVKQFLVKTLVLESMTDLLDYYVIYSHMILQRFAAFLAPLTSGRVNIAVNAVYISKVLLLMLILESAGYL